MWGSDKERGSHDPDVVASLKELAGKGSGKHRIVCESDGVATEHWLEGGEVRSREVPSVGQAAPSMAACEAAALSEFAALVPKLESELDGKEVADLDGIEIAIRDVTHSSGAAMYKSLLERVDAELPTPDCPQCGKPMERHLKFGKSFASRLGPVKVERTYCRCRGCGSGFFPLDRALGLEGQTATPGAASIVADAVVSDSFSAFAVWVLQGRDVPSFRVGAPISKILHRPGMTVGAMRGQAPETQDSPYRKRLADAGRVPIC